MMLDRAKSEFCFVFGVRAYRLWQRRACLFLWNHMYCNVIRGVLRIEGRHEVEFRPL